MIQVQIEDKLRKAFAPAYLNIENESYRHNVPAGAESHFKVVIVSDSFLNQRLLARHRAIYGALAEELAGSVHALALHSYTLQEWVDLQEAVPASPDCRGGSTLP